MTLPVQITADQRALVAELAGYGLTWAQIASALKLNVRTLQRHCQEDYDNGKNIAIGMAAGQLYKKVMSGHPASIFFYLKTQAGWKETNKTELTGENGEAIKTEGTVELTDRQIAAISRAFEKEY
ncbi:uncharacterized protein Usg [Pseudomonas migulae]|uniref:hypothetical protein n=1 Tax=Pseudomonas migulae TaxID=78543 RepID=UPI0020A0D246|nr:hypothetical protein [Pseudomonas migulae]MCP1496200.1 uncharacterized protein Usg [Pseudomonas migulae]